MSHRIPSPRVVRIVGYTRGELQQGIKNGELLRQDGRVEQAELLRVFPDVRREDDGEYRRVEEIKAKAFGKRIVERALPDKEVLAERLYELGREFASAKSMPSNAPPTARPLHSIAVLLALVAAPPLRVWRWMP